MTTTAQQKLPLEQLKVLATRTVRHQECIEYVFADKSFIEVNRYNQVARYLPNGWRL